MLYKSLYCQLLSIRNLLDENDVVSSICHLKYVIRHDMVGNALVWSPVGCLVNTLLPTNTIESERVASCPLDLAGKVVVPTVENGQHVFNTVLYAGQTEVSVARIARQRLVIIQEIWNMKLKLEEGHPPRLHTGARCFVVHKHSNKNVFLKSKYFGKVT